MKKNQQLSAFFVNLIKQKNYQTLMMFVQLILFHVLSVNENF